MKIPLPGRCVHPALEIYVELLWQRFQRADIKDAKSLVVDFDRIAVNQRCAAGKCVGSSISNQKNPLL